MKPVIVDMKDMSDSTEVYESKPNPIFVYFIYVLLALLLVAVGWMYFSKMDVLVKSNGMFRSQENAVDVSCSVAGMVTECNIKEGQYVEEGDILAIVETEALEMTISEYEEMLNDTQERLEMLQAYDRYLNGEKDILEAYAENKYYSEFAGKKRLLELGTQATDTDVTAQKTQYQKELNNVNQLISQYEGQIGKLRQTQECVKSRNNIFTTEDSYYESIVSSYISNYNLAASQYDAKIGELTEQIEEIQKQISELEQVQANVAEVDGNEPGEQIHFQESSSAESLKQQLAELQNTLSQLTSEKEANLSNLELQQIASIEQQIETISSTLLSTKSSQASIQAQIDTLNQTDNGKNIEMNRLTEQQNVASEILSYETKQTEYENILKQYDLENGYARIMATTSGYIYLNQELKVGSYITQGSTLCQILPENEDGYYAEIYVENADIAKLKEGQKVKFEIAAYPSSEYGYFTGILESISKDIKVDQSSGSAYYLVKVKCDDTIVTNEKGQTDEIMNGMACQAKVVVDEKNVLQYLLEKIDLVD